MTKIGDLIEGNPHPVDYIIAIYEGSDGLGTIEHDMLLRAGGKWYSELEAQWMELGHYGMAGHGPTFLPDVTDQNVEEYVTNQKAKRKKEIEERKQKAAEWAKEVEQRKRQAAVLGEMPNKDIISVEIPKGIVTIGKRAFYRCRKLTKVVIPASVTRIEDEAFFQCESLIEITLPDALTYIGRSAFSHSGLQSIRIPDSVRTIGASAFGDCARLERVGLPKGIVRIDDSSFAGCINLKQCGPSAIIYTDQTSPLSPVQKKPISSLVDLFNIKSTEEYYIEYQGKEYLAEPDYDKDGFIILDHAAGISSVSFSEVSRLYKFSLQICFDNLWYYGIYSVRKKELACVTITPHEEKHRVLTDEDAPRVTGIKQDIIHLQNQLDQFRRRSETRRFADQNGIKDTRVKYTQIDGREYVITNEQSGYVKLFRNGAHISVPGLLINQLYRYRIRFRYMGEWYQAEYHSSHTIPTYSLRIEGPEKREITGEQLKNISDIQMDREDLRTDLVMLHRRCGPYFGLPVSDNKGEPAKSQRQFAPEEEANNGSDALRENDLKNVQKMIDLCQTMKGWMERYDSICIRYYGDTRDTPGVLERTANCVLDYAITAGQFSEGFYKRHENIHLKELSSHYKQALYQYGRLDETKIWQTMEMCSRHEGYWTAILKQESNSQPKDQLYYVVCKLDEQAGSGMGDVKFHFSYLCINAQGMQCIISEDYIRHIRFGSGQGAAYLKPENLCSWKIKILSPEKEHYSPYECRRWYRANSRFLRQPPFAPKQNRT